MHPFTPLPTELERRIVDAAMPYYEQTRAGWDVPHIHASAYWMKRLIEQEGGNARILIPAIYLHDIGYYKLFNGKYDVAELRDKKLAHAVYGANMSRQILNEIGEFTPGEIESVAHLIEVHDRVDLIHSFDEHMVFEADSLGQIDRERVIPNLPYKESKKLLDHFKDTRVNVFQTPTGKENLARLLINAQAYLEGMRS